MISGYIWKCLRQGANPWKFFHLNEEYFNAEKGVFSKIELNNHIPRKWRLEAWELPTQKSISEWKKEILNRFKYPFFLKPEWGQNSHGIFRIKNQKELIKALEIIKKKETPYFCQVAGRAKKEIDIFYVRSANERTTFSILSLTESKHEDNEELPILSILSKTKYIDLTPQLNEKQQQDIMKICGKIGNFNMARIGIKCNNLEELIK